MANELPRNIHVSFCRRIIQRGVRCIIRHIGICSSFEQLFDTIEITGLRGLNQRPVYQVAATSGSKYVTSEQQYYPNVIARNFDFGRRFHRRGEEGVFELVE